MIDALLQEKITTRLIDTAPTIPVGVSNRHVHLSQQDVEALLVLATNLRPLSRCASLGNSPLKSV